MIRKKEQASGAPSWVVTYGDMMTLLFCFFLILVSMSEIKEDEKFEAVMESIKRAFGYQGGVGFTLGKVSPTNSLDRQLKTLIAEKYQLKEGKSSEEGIEGENPSVKTIREGLEFTIGGQVCFEPGRADLLPLAQKQLAEFSGLICGMNTRIKVKGHASPKSPQAYAPFKSLDELSYARGETVKQFLIANGIHPERITVEACGANEPLMAQAYDQKSQAMNRRVSIIITENLIQEYIGQSATETKQVIF
jgi:chemotaxis protein MotB